MKFLFILLFSISLFAQTAQQIEAKLDTLKSNVPIYLNFNMLNPDTVLSSSFSLSNFNFTATESFATNYGVGLDIEGTSLYFIFQNSSDYFQIASNNLFNFNSLQLYQVSEKFDDSLTIEGWNNNTLKYSTSWSKITGWRTIRLNYEDINKLIFRMKTISHSTDFNFDNFYFNWRS